MRLAASARRVVILVPMLALLGLGAAAAWMAPALLTPRLEATATRAIGHEVVIKGGLRLSWSGGPAIEARDVTVANAPWGSRPDMLRVASAQARLRLSDLQAGRLVIEAVRLNGPDLLLERDVAGQGNWERPAGAAPPAAAAAASGSGPAPSVRLSDITVEHGHITLHDTGSGRAFASDIAGTADLSSDRVPFRAALQGPAGTFQVAGAFDHATTAIEGTLDARLSASPDPAWAGWIPGPATLHATVAGSGTSYAIRDLRVSAPQGDLSGELDVGLAGKPQVRAVLSSQRLDLTMAVPAAPAAAVPTGPAVSPAAPGLPQSLFPAWLTAANGDLQLSAGEVRTRSVTARDLVLHATLRDGTLTLDKASTKLPGGAVTASGRAGASANPTMALVLHAPALDAASVLAAAGLPAGLGGTAAMEADLHATGVSAAALLASLGGRAALTMAGGELDLSSFTAKLAAAHVPVRVEGRVPLRCLVLRATLADGVAHLDPLIVDTNPLLVQGSGGIDLTQRTLSLHLRPLLRTGPGLVIPVSVAGPWAAPKLDVDRRDAFGSALAALAGDTGDACQAAGLAVAPLPRKPAKPGDLLRSLLR